MILITDIADAVAAELNAAPAGTFDPSFTAQRRVLPAFELAELVDLKVTVVPKAVQITGSTRSSSQYDLAVDIGVQRKLTSNNDSDVETLGTLVDQIGEYLSRRPLAGFPGAAWVSIANEPVYSPEHLLEQRVFTSALTVTYHAIR